MHCISTRVRVFFIAGLLCLGLGSQRAQALTVAEFGDGGFLNIDYQVQLRGAWRDIGSGPAGEDSTTDVYLRRNRLSLLGAANETFAFALQYEYNGGQRIGDLSVSNEPSDYDLKFLDGYIAVTVSNAFQIRAGKTKHIITREVQEGCFDPLSADRSIFINGPFEDKRTRDKGIVVWGNLASDKIQYRLAAMEGNNFGENKPDDAGYRYAGRIHYSFFDPESGFGYKGSYLGKKKVFTLGASYETEADAVYSSNTTGAEDYTAFSYDLFFEQPTDMGTFTVSGAYLKADFNEAGLRGVADAQGIDGEKNGTYWKVGYMVGKVQLFGRYEDWSFAELQGIQDQNIIWEAVGANYYIKGQDLRVTLEYSINDFSKEAISKDFKTAILQIQARF